MCPGKWDMLRNVPTKESLPGLMAHVGTAVDTERWPHVSGLYLPQAWADQVGLIIGEENSRGISSPLHYIWLP